VSGGGQVFEYFCKEKAGAIGFLLDGLAKFVK